MPSAASFVVTLASVMGAPPETAAQIGSWPGASPNQTMMRLLSERQPMLPPGETARLSSANRSASGMSPPPPAVHELIAAVTDGVALVGLSWCWNAYGSLLRKSL